MSSMTCVPSPPTPLRRKMTPVRGPSRPPAICPQVRGSLHSFMRRRQERYKTNRKLHLLVPNIKLQRGLALPTKAWRHLP